MPRRPRAKHRPPGPHHAPPKHKRVKNPLIKTFTSLLIASTTSTAVALVLNIYQISINVILPVIAPIFIGLFTLAYTQQEKH